MSSIASAIRLCLCIFGLTLQVGGCAPQASSSPRLTLVARVDGAPISLAQARRVFALRRLQADGAGAVDAHEDRLAWDATLADLTTRKLLAQAARAHHLAVFSGEVDQAWRALTAGWDPQALAAWLGERGHSGLGIKEELHETLLTQKYLRTQVLDRVGLLDRDIEAHLIAHPELLVTPEQVQLRHIVVADAKAAKTVAEALRRGGVIAQVAAAHSLASDAAQGGILGKLTRADLPASLAALIFALPRHKLSEPVVRADGLHMYWVDERSPKQVLSVAQARPRAETALRRERESAAAAEHIDALRRRAHIETFEVPFEDA